MSKPQHLASNMRRPVRALGAGAAIAALLAAAPAFAQTTQSQQMQAPAAETSAASLSSQDKTFVENAGPANLAEIEMGKLAMEKGSTPAIKEFGRWMVSAHSLASKELTAATAQMQMQMQTQTPMTLTAVQKTHYQTLEKLSGKAFDRQYLEAMVASHKKTMTLFKTEASDGQDLKIKTYATLFMPGVEQHLIEAKALLQETQSNS